MLRHLEMNLQNRMIQVLELPLWLQYRAYQNHPGIQLPYLLLGSGNKYSKCSQLKFTKGRVTSAITNNSLKATHNFFLFGGPSFCSNGALSVHSQLRPGNSFSYVPFDNGIRFGSPNCEAFSKRYFSQIPRVKNGNERTGVSDGRSGGKSCFNKWKNPVAAQGKNRATSSSISATEDVYAVTSTSEQLAGDGVEGAKLGSSTSSSSVSKTKQNSEVAGKQKQQSQSKKKKITGPRGQNMQKQLYPPTGKSVVVVESVTKAKVIQGFLGGMYEVLPSYGHVRELAARSGSVRPDDDFRVVWEVPSAAWKHLQSIKVALSGAENLILASDPDCEGEAIAWHIIEMLQQQDALHETITVARVVFHEITEASIKGALQAPREIDANLVQAYLARRALDYLIGFNISPLLWSKLPGCQSAGRVQSAALSLICDREMEIDEFKPQEYWTVQALLNTKQSHSSVDTFSFPAHLTHFHSKKLNQLSVSSHTKAKDIEQKINSANFQVVNSKRSMIRKNLPTPYITSTLQQDAANKLNFSAAYTMKLAQKLYEGIQLPDGTAAGLITYIRTDGLHISDEAAKEIHSLVFERYGSDHAPEAPRKYFKKVKNAQEAHEAIRPTDIRRLPVMLSGLLDEDSFKLYALIWSRTMACQMQPATIGQIQIDTGNSDESIVFQSSCSRVEFIGFQAAYEDVDAGAIRCKENEGNDRHEAFGILNSLKSGDLLYIGEVELKQHHTQPPPRYSEGSLVKKLEELGIGRPSTYASTLKVLQDRNYVTVKSRVLYPEFRGRMLSAFLSHHFSEVTDYSFTADMEAELDNVSAGLTEWKGLLTDYWSRFSSYCTRAQTLHIHQVEKMLEKTFGDSLFAFLPDKDRSCPCCGEGTLIFKVGRYGAGYFIGCNQHPKCSYIAKTLYGDDDEDDTTNLEERKVIGHHPTSNEKVLIKRGPYGFYVQLGEDRKGHLPKRASAHIKDLIEIVKVLQCIFINQDVHMYYEECDKPAHARTSNLNEELGQVHTILSDKTGTLTCNSMEFIKCSVAGTAYGLGVTEVERAMGRRKGSPLSDDTNPEEDSTESRPSVKGFNFKDERITNGNWVNEPNSDVIQKFFRLLAVCHTAIPEVDENTGKVAYEAESPDEAAFVIAARELGFEFYKRTQTSISLHELDPTTGKKVERSYTLLNVLEFNSTRKRMSVIVRDEGKLLLLCKGADSVMYERLAKNGRDFEVETMDHVNEYADAGLRTLILAYRELGEEEYKEFNEKFSEARNSISADRETLIDEVTETIEKDLVLLGATAVEDKLQNGVPDCIDKLAQAGIKIWVLTGDKMETAINIGFACSLLRQGMMQIIINLETPEILALEKTGAKSEITKASKESVLRQITEGKAQMSASGGSSDVFALIIDGKSLTYALEDDMKNKFLELAIGCASVICCRSSPKQKALVTRLVKSGTGKITLAIGDGANDVGMLQEADVGIGISGVEGMQAVMSSDIAIAQFRYLERLLLVHGHWCYRRISSMVCYFFYKNITFGLSVFLYEAYTSFSAQPAYNDWFLSLYSVFFTSLPAVAMGVFDQDVSARFCLKFPLLYQEGVQNILFSWRRIFGWMFNGVYSAIIIFFFCKKAMEHQAFDSDGRTVGRDIFGATMYTCIVWVVNLQMALAISYFTIIQHIFIWGSIALWYLFMLAYGAITPTFSTNAYKVFIEALAPAPSFWIVTLFMAITALVPYFSYNAIQMRFFPMYHGMIQWIRHEGLSSDPEYCAMVRQRSIRPTTVGSTARFPPRTNRVKDRYYRNKNHVSNS